jgi:hypothetical protein
MVILEGLVGMAVGMGELDRFVRHYQGQPEHLGVLGEVVLVQQTMEFQLLLSQLFHGLGNLLFSLVVRVERVEPLQITAFQCFLPLI